MRVCGTLGAMGRVVLARSVSMGIAFVLVSLLPLHPDTRIPTTPACPADRAEMCRMKHAECPALHPPGDPSPATSGCAAEYAVRCRPDCGEPVPSGGFVERLLELGPWWIAALPGGPEAWASLRGWIGHPRSP
jgi:hypothetical protein